MNDIDARLRRCFSLTFPDLAASEIPSAEQSRIQGWDSVAAITLVTLIEEEFAISVDLDKMPELTSFVAIREYVSGAA